MLYLLKSRNTWYCFQRTLPVHTSTLSRDPHYEANGFLSRICRRRYQFDTSTANHYCENPAVFKNY